MSLESWKAEFYPTEAKTCSESEAVKHSLLKWEGLTEDNLYKHNCHILGIKVCDREDANKSLNINHTSCALCIHYYDEDPVEMYEPCSPCPIVRETGFNCMYEYNAWDATTNPQLMIDLLKSVHENRKVPSELSKQDGRQNS